jgi:hypothetical protein
VKVPDPSRRTQNSDIMCFCIYHVFVISIDLQCHTMKGVQDALENIRNNQRTKEIIEREVILSMK